MTGSVSNAELGVMILAYIDSAKAISRLFLWPRLRLQLFFGHFPAKSRNLCGALTIFVYLPYIMQWDNQGVVSGEVYPFRIRCHPIYSLDLYDDLSDKTVKVLAFKSENPHAMPALNGVCHGAPLWTLKFIHIRIFVCYFGTAWPTLIGKRKN